MVKSLPEQAPAPARPKPPPPPAAAFRLARGLVFFRLRPIRFGLADGSQRRGQVLTQMRNGPDPPPYGAEAWKEAGGKWSENFGGRWLERGTGKLEWEWLA